VRRDGRAALVTGGGGGIGRVIVRTLVDRGIRCCITGRTPSALDETAAASGASASALVTCPGDISNPQDRRRVVEACVEAFDTLDILVNNAGGSSAHPLLSYPLETWREEMAVNVEAAAFLAQQTLPFMLRQRWGRIVNIGSVYGSLALNNRFYGTKWPTGHPDGPYRALAYSASKGALAALSRDLAAAVGPHGVTVNTVSPGMIQTDQRPIPPERERELSGMTPVGRLGTPDDVAHAVAFLVSEQAGFVTGHELVVDGGWSIW
jgi:NAD(P)-dependent dehydrogenase (short-subunit alcohol dehydrogenase family)